MQKTRSAGLNFSQSLIFTADNVALAPTFPCMYMICKKDLNGSDEVIFAGMTTCLKTELSHYLHKTTNAEDLTFCFVPATSPMMMNKPLYQQKVA